MFADLIPPSVAVDAVRVSTDVGELWLPADDRVILPYMKSSGTWEPGEAQMLRSLLQPNSRFLDVGANVGYFSALAAKLCPQGTIDAVEPEPRSVSLLRLNLWTLAPHARVWPVGLGLRRGIAALRTEEGNPGNTFVEEDSPRASRLTALVCGDELFAGRRFDVIKVDVQGYEPEVIRGLEETLRQSGNVSLVVEFFPEALRQRGLSPSEVLRLYRGMGFERLADVAGRLLRLDDEELLSMCQSSGKNGFVNLLLRKTF
ncbi:FkbM family methyltransferase [Stigmatella sp. ncwal1]|uniref:FkbM family methyltransferase n=1 Tax=Stigmatella ashevillensis TaxID=2995309 RepID=A0ABT5D3R2_9BACT|nr:FkbM family methyltransferase [Stigmatella ashevillena]MDC0708315.1 FkbM family methyltransferase [Stigmatella ashevillena]